jgi:hypothetical protein
MPRQELVAKLYADRWRAHQFLFEDRHPDESPPAHAELIERIHSPTPRFSFEGFRGLGKTTLVEEGVILRAAFREFRYCVIVSANFRPLAIQRIASIKHEIEFNERLIGAFGKLRGETWQEGIITLSNGVCIQAIGRDMSVTGMKHLNMRPDALMIDDVEDPDEIRTDIERNATWQWFQGTLLPCMDDPLNSWARALGTRRGKGSMPERLEDNGWSTYKVPVEYLDRETGERKSSWPSRRPLPWIDKTRHDYRGDMHLFMQEYMCQATSEQHRVFTREALKVEARPRPSYQAVYAMYDPARTAHRGSATTGIAVWSWFGSRLVFWRVEAKTWMPDQIIADMFDLNREFQPVWIGFEEDGLNEWGRQPIRAEMLKRRTMLPLMPIKAPKSKLDFIKRLQPYSAAGELSFAGESGDFEDAISQFLSFPHGKIDAPNACAYAPLLYPGAPVYDNFTEANVSESAEPEPGKPLYLAGNADGAVVTAILVQRHQGELRILADWIREGAPQDIVGDIYAEASLAAETSRWEERVEYGEGDELYKLPVRRMVWNRIPIKWIVPSWHRDTYRNVGLVQAIRAIPSGIGMAEGGETVLRGMLSKLIHGRPALAVSPAARWTLRALSGGYTKPIDKRGLVSPKADAGLYRLLMEGVEAFAAVGSQIEQTPDEDGQPIAHNRHGMAYRSAMPVRG